VEVPDSPDVRICLVYDCLYPWTVGGAERWMRSLAEALAAEGHEVTYLTRKQWTAANPPQIPGVRVIAVSGPDELYGAEGNRRKGPPLRFGVGVLRHLAAHRHAYDVVHTGAFPYFPLLAAGAVRTQPLFVDWFEVWSKDYWRGYLGGAGGLAGWLVQRACARVPQQAFTFSELHATRLRQEGLRSTPIRLGGLYGGSTAPPDVAVQRAPLVVFAGRHIPEKRVTAIPAAIAAARDRVPGLRALILGDGPVRDEVLRAVEAHGVGDCVEVPGFVAAEAVQEAVASAACLLLPSQREGYGLVVIEAAASGTPSVVAAGEDNAAVELIEPGVNGVVAASDRPVDLADAIVAAVDGGAALRTATATWFAEHADELTVTRSLQQVLAAYEHAAGGRRGAADQLPSAR
jgi:glycosyltransferase involved in cell wall biosynthesis